MKKTALALALVCARLVCAQTPAPHREANFDEEHTKANELYLKGYKLEAGKLYGDLSRQDPTVAVFAERHASGLIAEADIEKDPAKSKALHEQAMAEMRRAKALGDDSDIVRTALGMDEDAKRAQNASGPPRPVPVGYRTTSPNEEANRFFRDAETAFAKNDMAGAKEGFAKAAAADPQFYMAKLYAGDACFANKEYACAEDWFAKAIALDPNRETAYRYWGDALLRSGQPVDARAKFEEAIVAEPYVRLSWNGLAQWAGATHTQMGTVDIKRPKVSATDVTFDPAATDADKEAWKPYLECRRQGDAARRPGQRHTADQEVYCLAQVADAAEKSMQAGKTQSVDYGSGLQALIALQKTNMLESWLLLNGADREIVEDYDTYRATHRDLLLTYLDKWVVHTSAPPTNQRPNLDYKTQ